MLGESKMRNKLLYRVVWTSTDIALPAFDGQKVKIKVADFVQDYNAIGYFNHRQNEWNILLEDGTSIPSDNVYSWKLM